MGIDRAKGQLELMLLGILRGGPQHGYAIVSALRERSSGEFDLPEGTVYPALHRLENSGLLQSTWEMVGGRRRRLYRLSPTGLAALGEAARRWARFSSSVNAVLAGAAIPVMRPA
jgi:PadR family transcriptional regulator, regulatory protein PadR